MLFRSPEDRAYFRQSRGQQFGMTLEQYSADHDSALAHLHAVCVPLERTLSEQPFLAGPAPAYVDYVVFSVFQWARIGSPRDELEGEGSPAAIRSWRSRMVALFDNLGDRFAGYPSAVEQS